MVTLIPLGACEASVPFAYHNGYIDGRLAPAGQGCRVVCRMRRTASQAPGAPADMEVSCPGR